MLRPSVLRSVGITVAVAGCCAVAAVGSASGAVPLRCSQAGNAVTCSFASTGAEQTFSVPSGVASVHVVAVGGRGYSPLGGGFGAVATADLPVVAGEVLYVEVAGDGGAGDTFGGSGGLTAEGRAGTAASLVVGAVAPQTFGLSPRLRPVRWRRDWSSLPVAVATVGRDRAPAYHNLASADPPGQPDSPAQTDTTTAAGPERRWRAAPLVKPALWAAPALSAWEDVEQTTLGLAVVAAAEESTEAEAEAEVVATPRATWLAARAGAAGRVALPHRR